MSTTARIVALAGSTRRDSYNKRLARIAAQGAEAIGAEVTVVELNDHPMPLFDEDLEAAEGPPAGAKSLKALLVAADGLLIASPEYNSSISAVLKNAIDWVSRPVPGEAPLIAFRGKVAGLLSASPGGFGGLRGLVHLRSILGNIGVVVLPDQISIPSAHDAFGDDGRLKDPKKHQAVADLGRNLAEVAARLKG